MPVSSFIPAHFNFHIFDKNANKIFFSGTFFQPFINGINTFFNPSQFRNPLNQFRNPPRQQQSQQQFSTQQFPPQTQARQPQQQQSQFNQQQFGSSSQQQFNFQDFRNNPTFQQDFQITRFPEVGKAFLNILNAPENSLCSWKYRS